MLSYPSCMVDLPRLCNVLVGDLKSVFVMHERSPPHLFLYMFLFNKETKYATNKGSIGLNTGEPKTYLLLLLLYLSIYYVYFYLFTNLFILKQG